MDSPSLKRDPTFLRGLLWMLLASLCLSTTPPIVKWGYQIQLGPISLLTFRMLSGAIALWAAFALWDPPKLKIDAKGRWLSFWAALINSVSLCCFYIGLTYVHASVATVIFSAFPIITLLFLALRKEPIQRIDSLRVGLSLVGVYLLVGPGGNVSLIGVLCITGTAVLFSLHLALVQWWLRGYPAETTAIYIVTWMALQLSVVYLIVEHKIPSFSLQAWGVILWTGLISTALGRLAMFSGIRLIGSGQAALFGPLETLMTVVWAMLFLHERFLPIQWVGSTFIIAGGLLVFARKAPVQAPKA